MSSVEDPRGEENYVKRPVIAWEGKERMGTETWEGRIAKLTTVPQVELKRMLDNGGTGIIRLNVGTSATNGKGKYVDAGVLMSSNKSVNLVWSEYYSLRIAIDEAVEVLVTEHERMRQAKADKLAAKRKRAEPLDSAVVSPVGEGDPDFDDQ